MENKYPRSRKVEIVVQEMNGETLVYDLKESKAFCLNQTSALIWEMCDGTKSLSDISQQLSKKLKLPANEGLVWLALEQLKKENLLESEYTVPVEYAGMTRREAVRKVGLATMIAIPMVMSLAAPVAIAASSNCGTPLCHCAAPTACNAGNAGTLAPDQSICPGAALPEFPTTPSSVGACSPNCRCVGPFICVGNGSHKEGRCGRI